MNDRSKCDMPSSSVHGVPIVTLSFGFPHAYDGSVHWTESKCLLLQHDPETLVVSAIAGMLFGRQLCKMQIQSDSIQVHL